MELTNAQIKVLEAIFCLRTGAGRKTLRSIEVATRSGVSRQNWSVKSASSNWKAIKLCIEGNLPSTHPLEIMIAGYHESGKFQFSARIVELERSVAAKSQAYNALLEDFELFKSKIYTEKYRDAHTRVNFEKNQQRLEAMEANSAQDKRLINSYQAEVSNLTAEIKKIKQLIHFKSTNKFLFTVKLTEPYLDDFEGATSQADIYNLYMKSLHSSLEKISAEISENEASDIFIIFHRFDVDVDDLAKNNIPYKLPGNSYVFACYAPTDRTRIEVYNKLRKLLTFPPTVILIGKMKTDNMPVDLKYLKKSKFSKTLIDLAKNYRFMAFDIINEGYENVLVLRP